MAEQSIQFGLRTGNHTPLRDGEGVQHSVPDDADPQAAARFGQAMAQSEADAVALDESHASPFSLLGSGLVTTGTATVDVARRHEILGLLHHLVQRLLVSEDPQGRREVRMTLAEDLLPGVTVALYEDAGAWVADLCCSDVSSYETLARPASQMASQLAQALACDAVWRVKLDEISAGEPMAIEAFASCP
jgi:hypothetical protein